MGKKKEKKSCVSANKTYHQQMVMQLQDQYGYINGDPFTIDLLINIDGDKVTIQVPAINTPIVSGYPYTGSLIVTVDKFLPKCLWPKTLVYLGYEVKPDNASSPLQELTLYVGNDGSIRIGSTTNFLNVIPDGFQVTIPTTITYIVENLACIVKPPKNVQVSTKRSNTIITGYSGFFLEFYDVSITNNNVAVCFASNSADFPTSTMDQSVATGKVVYDECNRPQLQMNLPQVVVKATERTMCVEMGVAINPNNTNNIVSVTLFRDRTTVDLRDFFQGWRAYSIDGGLNWTSSRIENTVFVNQRGRSDWNIACDKYGNFWFFGLYQFSDGSGGWINSNRFIGFAVSSDGGQTFKEVGQLSPNDPDFAADYPRLSFGGDGQGGYGAWTSSVDIKTDFTSSKVNIGFFPIIDLGNIGPITQYHQNNLTYDSTIPALKKPGAMTFGEILATPDGKVYYIGNMSDISPEPLGRTYISANLNGFNGFGENSFGSSKLIDYTNITVGASSNIIYNGNRGGKSASFRVGYDSVKNRIYMGYEDQKPARSGNMNIDLIYSDNDGSSWSVLGSISDTDQNVRGNVSMGRDNSNGNLLFSWYDARGDPTGESVNMFAAVINPDILKYVKNHQCCDCEPICINHNQNHENIMRNMKKLGKITSKRNIE